MKKVLAAALMCFSVVGYANTVTIGDSIDPKFYSKKVIIYFNPARVDYWAPSCAKHAHRNRAISIDWSNANEAAQKGKALQVTRMIAKMLQSEPVKFWISGCTKDSLGDVYTVD